MPTTSHGERPKDWSGCVVGDSAQIAHDEVRFGAVKRADRRLVDPGSDFRTSQAYIVAKLFGSRQEDQFRHVNRSAENATCRTAVIPETKRHPSISPEH